MFREKEARRQHRPPFYVMPDPALVWLAMNPASSLSTVPGLGQYGLQRFGSGFKQALHEGFIAPPIRRPPSKTEEPMSQDQLRRLGRLKAWRISLGAALSLDPSLLWPMSSLERLAKMPESLGVEIASPDVRGWQRDLFTDNLSTFMESLK